MRCKKYKECKGYSIKKSCCELNMGSIEYNKLCPLILDLTQYEEKSKYFKKIEKKVKWDGIGLIKKIRDNGGIKLFE